MNEQIENTVAEAQTAAMAEAVAKEGVMPPEERSRNAARRRAAEQRETEEREAALRQEILAHPLMQEAISLLENSRFKQDLAIVREVYPELETEDPREVGEVYCRLMAQGGIDPVVAYEAQLAANRRREPKPPEMVPAAASGGAAAFYSSRELDRLTAEDLKDPGVFRKAMASLAKLRK